MTPAELHEQHKARVLGIACSTCSDVGVTGDTCAALGHDPGTTRQHHDEAADALVVEALQEAGALIRRQRVDGCPSCGRPCPSCRALDRALGKIAAALKALGK